MASFEEVYQECLEIELRLRDIPFQSHPKLILSYKGKQLEKSYIPDLYVYDGIVVELKAIKQLIDERVHGKSIEDVSRLFFPGYWARQEEEEMARDAILTEALTIHDQPCMSYFRK